MPLDPSAAAGLVEQQDNAAADATLADDTGSATLAAYAAEQHREATRLLELHGVAEPAVDVPTEPAAEPAVEAAVEPAPVVADDPIYEQIAAEQAAVAAMPATPVEGTV